MTLELSRKGPAQPQPAATTESGLQPSALAGAESHLAEAHTIRKGIAQGAIGGGADVATHGTTADPQAAQVRMRRIIAASDSRTQDNFHESMNHLGRKAIREQPDSGRQHVAAALPISPNGLPQMKTAEPVKPPETASEILASGRHVQAQPSEHALPVTQSTTAPQTTSS